MPAEKQARLAPAKKKRTGVTKDDEQEDEENGEKEQEEQAEAGMIISEHLLFWEEPGPGAMREVAPEPGQSRSDGPKMPKLGDNVMHKGAIIYRKEGSFRVVIPKTVAKQAKKFEVTKKYGDRIAIETAFTNSLTYVDERLR